MSFFVRSLAGIILVICLSFTVGCVSKGGQSTAKGISLPWAAKEPERAQQRTMEQVLLQDKVNAIR